MQSVRNVLNPIPFTNTQCDYIKYYTNDLSELIFFLAKTVDCHLTHRDFGISDKYRRWGSHRKQICVRKNENQKVAIMKIFAKFSFRRMNQGKKKRKRNSKQPKMVMKSVRRRMR